MANAGSFRLSAFNISPGWLRESNGAKLVYTFAVALDGITQWVYEGVSARFPLEATPDALPFIGRDRGIVHAILESNAQYAARLLTWLDAWRIAGNAVSVLAQVAGYLGPNPPMIRIVTNSGVWYTLEDGVVTWYRADPNNWNWDNAADADAWSRFWLIIYPGSFGLGGDYGDLSREWGDGGTIGTDALPFKVATIRQIVAKWKGPHSKCHNVIVAFDAASFDPTAAPGAAGMPDGTWGRWSKNVGGAYVRSRLATARYCDGV